MLEKKESFKFMIFCLSVGLASTSFLTRAHNELKCEPTQLLTKVTQSFHWRLGLAKMNSVLPHGAYFLKRYESLSLISYF